MCLSKGVRGSFHGADVEDSALKKEEESTGRSERGGQELGSPTPHVCIITDA